MHSSSTVAIFIRQFSQKLSLFHCRACILIAILFVISGIAIDIKATYNLTKEWIPFLKVRVLCFIAVLSVSVPGGGNLSFQDTGLCHSNRKSTTHKSGKLSQKYTHKSGEISQK